MDASALEGQIVPKPPRTLCEIFETGMASYAGNIRSKLKGKQKNQHLGELAVAIAQFGNDDVLLTFLDSFFTKREKTSGAFYGRIFKCSVDGLLDATDHDAEKFNTAYTVEQNKKIGSPDPDLNVPAKKDRPTYRGRLMQAVKHRLENDATLASHKREMYAHLFNDVISMDDTQLRNFLVIALQAHFQRNQENFTAALNQIFAIKTVPYRQWFMAINSEWTGLVHVGEFREIQEQMGDADDDADQESDQTLPKLDLDKDLAAPTRSVMRNFLLKYSERTPAGASLPLIGGAIQGRVDYAPFGKFLGNLLVLDKELFLMCLYASLHALGDESLRHKVKGAYAKTLLELSYMFALSDEDRLACEKNGKLRLASLTHEQKIEFLGKLKSLTLKKTPAIHDEDEQRFLMVLINPIIRYAHQESTSYEERDRVLSALLAYVSVVKNKGDNTSLIAFRKKTAELNQPVKGYFERFETLLAYMEASTNEKDEKLKGVFKEKVFAHTEDSVHEYFAGLCKTDMPEISQAITQHRTQMKASAAKETEVAAVAASPDADPSKVKLPSDKFILAAAPAPLARGSRSSSTAERDAAGISAMTGLAKRTVSAQDRQSQESKTADTSKAHAVEPK